MPYVEEAHVASAGGGGRGSAIHNGVAAGAAEGGTDKMRDGKAEE